MSINSLFIEKNRPRHPSGMPGLWLDYQFSHIPNSVRNQLSQNYKYLIINYLNASCGQQDNYRTNFNDFRAVYLFGIQMDIKLYSRTSNQVFLNT